MGAIGLHWRTLAQEMPTNGDQWETLLGSHLARDKSFDIVDIQIGAVHWSSSIEVEAYVAFRTDGGGSISCMVVFMEMNYDSDWVYIKDIPEDHYPFSYPLSGRQSQSFLAKLSPPKTERAAAWRQDKLK